MRRIAVTALAAALASLLMPPGNAWAAGRPPRLERFVARYNPTSTTTFYIAVAGDPDGGKLTYRWSLNAECGFLTDPQATGPSQGYQHGPPARRPDGCTSEQDRNASITLRIVDGEGCSIVYTQAARDETEHVSPKVATGLCPPDPRAAAGSNDQASFPVVPILVAGVLALLIFTAIRVGGRARARAREELRWSAAEQGESSEPAAIVPPFEPESELAVAVEPTGESPREDSGFEKVPATALIERAKRALSGLRRPAAAEEEPDLPWLETPESEPSDSDSEPESEPVSPAPPVRTDAHGLPSIRSRDPLAADVPAFMSEQAPPAIDEAEEVAPVFERTRPVEPEPDSDEAALERILGVDPGVAPCREGAVRQADSDFVAHETLLAGTVRARALRTGATVDVPADDPAEILRLAAGMSDDAPLEVEVAIPVRLVTVVSSRREVCRGGIWVPEVASTTHDGPERIERLRAIATTPDELERFAREILAKRLRSLTGARRRLESALSALRGRI